MTNRFVFHTAEYDLVGIPSFGYKVRNKMLATMSVKGQVTVPKFIRDQLRIEQGTQLDFSLDDDSISVRPLRRSALSIVGLLRRPDARAFTMEEMSDAVGDAAVERSQRSRYSEARLPL